MPGPLCPLAEPYAFDLRPGAASSSASPTTRRCSAIRYFWRALVNTFIVVIVVVHVELLLGLGMALLFAGGLPARALLLAVVLAPYAVSEVVGGGDVALPVRAGYRPRDASSLHALGLPPLEWSVEPAHGLLMVALLSIWLHLPFTFIILYAARLAIPTRALRGGADRRRRAPGRPSATSRCRC